MPVHQTGRRRVRLESTPLSGPVFLGLFSRRTWDNNGNEIWTNDPISGSGPGWTFHTYPDTIVSYELCVDSVHVGPPWKDGGQLKLLKMTRSAPYGEVYGSGTYTRRDGNAKYIGGFHAPGGNVFGEDFQISDIDLTARSRHFPTMEGVGDKAYNKTKPRIEKAGGAVFVAELRDVPKMLATTASGFHDTWKALGGNLTSKTMTPKGVADQFLNQQFGWAPFLSDLRKFNHVIQNRGTIIQGLSARNGKSTRRRVTLSDETTNTVVGQGTGLFVYPNSVFTGIGQDFSYWRDATLPTWELQESIKTHISSSGRFSYYRPEFDESGPDYSSVWNRGMRNAAIFGLRVNPSNIWKATPWTWAIDWVVNVGDHIDYLNDIAVDSVACQYLYVMQHRIIRRTFSQTLPFIGGDVVLHFSRTVETKQRQPISSPFGPSLTWETLSPRQLAIAAALGISRT